MPAVQVQRPARWQKGRQGPTSVRWTWKEEATRLWQIQKTKHGTRARPVIQAAQLEGPRCQLSARRRLLTQSSTLVPLVWGLSPSWESTEGWQKGRRQRPTSVAGIYREATCLWQIQKTKSKSHNCDICDLAQWLSTPSPLGVKSH
jgi:hypothetical protein